VRPDPRTDRFSGSSVAAAAYAFPNTTQRSDPATLSATGNFYPTNQAFSLLVNGQKINQAPNYGINTMALALFLQNEVTAPSFAPKALSAPLNVNSYYTDADGIVRPADGYATDGTGTTTGDGCDLFQTIDISRTTGLQQNVLPNTANVRRPVILNRPFRNVGELGYAFRDDPFRTLDFWTPLSADSALMDLFSISDEPPIIAGQVDPNNAPVPVLKAIISGAAQNSDLTGTTVTDTGMTTVNAADTAAIAQAISNQLATTPLRNRADLGSLGPAIQTYASTGTATLYLKNKADGEAPIRALSSVTNTRTWNLLIDIIAQSGQIPQSGQTLNDFVVEGERRYWLHVAIDRYTGKIVAQQLEPVYE
jgi:hypothetical protein